MFKNNTFNNILTKYLEITSCNSNISKLGKPFNYKLGNDINTNLFLNKNILYIDIKRSGPSILKLLLGKDNEFVIKVNGIDNKKERSKLITTTLKYNNKYGINIDDILIWQKILILGYCYSLYKNITILEYNNDGLIFTHNDLIHSNNIILDFINENNIEYNFENILEYYYINKNTYMYIDTNNIIIHGIYKNIPSFFKDYIIPNIIVNKLIHDNDILNNIYQKYNKYYYKILAKLNDKVSINKYYGFLYDNTFRYLTYNNKFISDYKGINVEEYKRNIIYPMVLLNRVYFKN